MSTANTDNTTQSDKTTVTLVQNEKVIQKPIQEVWDYLVNPNNIVKYRSHMSNGSVKLENGTNDGKLSVVGAKLHCECNDKKKTDMEVIQCDAPNKLVMKINDGPWKGYIDTLQLDEVTKIGDDKAAETIVIVSLSMEGSLVSRLMARMHLWR
eukprot:144029_1